MPARPHRMLQTYQLKWAWPSDWTPPAEKYPEEEAWVRGLCRMGGGALRSCMQRPGAPRRVNTCVQALTVHLPALPLALFSATQYGDSVNFTWTGNHGLWRIPGPNCPEVRRAAGACMWGACLPGTNPLPHTF